MIYEHGEPGSLLTLQAEEDAARNEKQRLACTADMFQRWRELANHHGRHSQQFGDCDMRVINVLGCVSKLASGTHNVEAWEGIEWTARCALDVLEGRK